jgi:(1->4)-alpha-D-glucan 1-alpha-D-glucosylmutase
MTVRATYRVQFHKDFTFADAAALADYFDGIGISHLYASPILAARAGSMHGYDVIDPARINTELGGEEGFRALAAALHARHIGIVLDIVPNHMAVGGADNNYWLDLLEKGPDSVFANLFDIDWEPTETRLKDKVLAPFLGEPLAESLAAGKIALDWDEGLGKFAFAYGPHRFPLRREDYPAQGETDFLARANAPETLRALLARQNFRLSCWRDAGERINWRRFFDITGLAALRVEDDGVFELTHALVFRLFGEGLIDGLRVDHIDGLADPAAYCRRLRARLEALLPRRQWREPPLIVVEKILAPGESLPDAWQVDGTTGYDFMNWVSAFQHDAAAAESFTRIWTGISGRPPDFESEERAARREILMESFSNALRATAAAFRALEPGIDAADFEAALSYLLEFFRAYRTYATGDSPTPQPGHFFDAALQKALEDCGGLRPALEAVAAAMRGELPGARDAARRFNQLAAPVAAKAVEDTAFYRYGRILSRNDVGFAPGRFAFSGEDFAAAIAARGYPRTLLATATHDHKRGEDVRARLAALSEIPQLWQEAVADWFARNAPLRPPEILPGDEYQLYQTLVGCWPPGLTPDDAAAMDAFTRRIAQWQEKALHEAKLRTSWTEPNGEFEKANAAFTAALLDPERSPEFLRRLSAFTKALAPAGILNSLVQCVLRLTCPGMPDLYQGTELWDFSLVDPDNRGAVDFVVRRAFLAQSAAPAALLARWQDGAVKLVTIRRLLALRREMPGLFAAGSFEPLEVGPHAFAFLRRTETQALLVVVPHLCAASCIARNMPLPDAGFWGDVLVSLPPDFKERVWRNVLDGRDVTDLHCAALFADFPAAVLLTP